MSDMKKKVLVDIDVIAVAVPKAVITLEKMADAIGRALETKETSGTIRIKVAVGVK